MQSELLIVGKQGGLSLCCHFNGFVSKGDIYSKKNHLDFKMVLLSPNSLTATHGLRDS